MRSGLAVVLLLGSAVPAAADILLTQVDAQGGERGDSYPATCADGVCRVTIPVDFGRHACEVNAWVGLPRPDRSGGVIFAVGRCVPDRPAPDPAPASKPQAFEVDRLRAATRILRVDMPVAADQNDLVLRAREQALIRIDVVMPGAGLP